ncbi:MAG TPA: GNAT family N-acetyltransferase, partial [Saprospiraceae bacterium]|nr:GNAT family N-acetyltransferase [Saprospiraceae bacterium]
EFEQIGNLMVRVYSQLDGFPKADRQPEYFKLLANVGQLTQKPGVEILVAATPDGKILGAVVYFREMKYYGASGSASQINEASGFRLLAVDPAAQGMGIGKKLSEACIEKAREHQANAVIIHTTRAMQTAWDMYERLGFIRFPEIDFMVGDFKVFGFKLPLDRDPSPAERSE